MPEMVNVNKKLWKINMLLMGKSTISMAIFNSELLVYQRVCFFLCMEVNLWKRFYEGFLMEVKICRRMKQNVVFFTGVGSKIGCPC